MPRPSPRHAGRPSRIGQNFLIDRNVARRIVRAASLEPGDHVLEIGPGRGALTGPLLDAASRVVAVEIDEYLAGALSERFGEEPNFELVIQDALEFDPNEYFSRPYKFVANLPYYVATPIIRRMLAARPAPSRPTRIIVMVQREVAAAMTAPPGRMSLLSVMIQTHAAARMLFTVPPRAFRPHPKVTSAVVSLEPYDTPSVPVADTSAFIDFAAAGFRAPRKQIRNSLSIGLSAPPADVEASLAAARIDPRRRPSTLTLTEWADVYNAWTDMNSDMRQTTMDKPRKSTIGKD